MQDLLHVQCFLQDITFSQCLVLRGYDLEVSLCICIDSAEKKWPSAVDVFFSIQSGTADPLFLLDRLEFGVVDLFSGDEQVEPRVEFFQMRILRYCRVNISRL